MRCLLFRAVSITLLLAAQISALADSLVVVADFEGASVADVVIDQTARTINFRPGGQPQRGWPCWWYFRIDGLTPGETLTLRLHAGDPAAQSTPALAAIVREAVAFSMPAQATYSSDGVGWQHTEKGVKEEGVMTSKLQAATPSLYVAWGPPYTPTDAERFVREMSRRHPAATAEELCRSEGDRAVPMISLRDRFIDLAYQRISRIKPLIPMSNRPKTTGAAYHPLWRQISANWVSMNGNPQTAAIWPRQQGSSLRNAGDSGKGQNRAATVRVRGSAFVAKSIQENVSAFRCHALLCTSCSG